MKNHPQIKFWLLVLFFVAIKVIIHALTNTNYELHRDAFLYLAQGDHLAWGYLSVPPLTAFLSKILRLITGDSIFAVRLFPLLIGSLSVIFVNLIVKELGGKRWAMILASIAFIFSPAFLRSNMLLQPVSLGQFFWLTSFYLLVRIINTQNPKYWIFMSINFAFGLLTKYSIIFLIAGFFIGFILTPYRKLMVSRYLLIGLILGLALISPNIIWQHQNGWPVIYHMEMLRQYHLVNVRLLDFLTAQFIMHLPVTFFWLAGLIYLLFHPGLRRYSIIGFIYIIVILLLIFTKGKFYYSIGLYSVLFAVGGLVFEGYIQQKWIVYLNLVFVFLISMVMLPFSLPILGHERMLVFCQKCIDKGLDMPMRWEDGKLHSLPQDYADMIGWEELGKNVIAVYNTIPRDEQVKCYIYAENYGEAGAIRYYGLKSGLPEPISFHGSFVFWAPEKLSNLKYFIYVNNNINGIKDYFYEIKKFEGITNPYARESGLCIYLCINPNKNFNALYRRRLDEELSRFKR